MTEREALAVVRAVLMESGTRLATVVQNDNGAFSVGFQAEASGGPGEHMAASLDGITHTKVRLLARGILLEWDITDTEGTDGNA